MREDNRLLPRLKSILNRDTRNLSIVRFCPVHSILYLLLLLDCDIVSFCVPLLQCNVPKLIKLQIKAYIYVCIVADHGIIESQHYISSNSLISKMYVVWSIDTANRSNCLTVPHSHDWTYFTKQAIRIRLYITINAYMNIKCVHKRIKNRPKTMKYRGKLLICSNVRLSCVLRYSPRYIH